MENEDSSAQPIEILVVDDRPENLAAVRAAIADPSYELVEAHSAREALKEVLRREFAVILLDVYLPDADGFEVASIIKSRPRTARVPIVFLTAGDSASDRRQLAEALRAGGADFIAKPFDADILRARVGLFVELHRRELRIRGLEQTVERHELAAAGDKRPPLGSLGEQMLQDLAEGMSQSFVWSADPSTLRYRYVSPRAEPLLGYPVEQWLTERGFFASHVHPDDRDRALEMFSKAQAGRDLGFEHRFVTASGDVVWLHTGVRLARKGEGVGTELRGLSIDITHLKEIEGALREAVSTRDEFLSIVSHELKTPLTPLKLQLELLSRNLTKGDPATLTHERLAKVIGMWQKQLDRLIALIEDLLDMSRIRAGRLTIHPQAMDLSQLVSEVVERYRGVAESAGCTIKAAVLAGVVGRWDRDRLEQILLNLITNAIKYAPGKPIEIGLRRNEAHAELSVKDAGAGITKEDQLRIFDRFERGAPRQNQLGLGLGLYISRSIADAHGGSIRVESEPGDGATFIVQLPYFSPVEEHAAEAEPGSPSH